MSPDDMDVHDCILEIIREKLKNFSSCISGQTATIDSIT